MIRRIAHQDIPALVKVHVESWKTAYQGIIDETYLQEMSISGRLNDWKTEMDQGMEGYLHATNHVIDGFLTYKRVDVTTIEVLWLYVDPTRFRSGIGSKLLHHFESQMTSRQTLFLDTVFENAISMSFYRKSGFTMKGPPRSKIVLGATVNAQRFEKHIEL